VGALERIAMSAAGEHIIWAISYQILASRGLSDAMAPPARKLFMWHSLEEMEHKTVAWDVCNHLAGVSYKMRVVAFFRAVSLLGRALVSISRLALEAERPESRSARQRASFTLRYFLLPGYLLRTGLRSLTFLSPFHRPGFNRRERELLQSADLMLDGV
jgi:predicted metal-dependent hydrolase